MDSALNKTSLRFGVPGFVLMHIAMFFPMALGYKHPQDLPVWTTALSWTGFICGGALFIVGLGYYAAAKGHSRWAGLIGLLSVIGLIVLACLPDRRKRATSVGQASEPTAAVPPLGPAGTHFDKRS